MLKRKIKCDQKGNVLNWYGFWPSNDVESEECHIKISVEEPGTIELYAKDSLVGKISVFHFLVDNMESEKVLHTENKIWNFIYREVRKYPETKHHRVFIDKVDVDFCGKAYSLCDLDIPELLDEVEAYFIEKELQHLGLSV